MIKNATFELNRIVKIKCITYNQLRMLITTVD